MRGGIAFADGVLYFTAEEKLFAVDVATQKKRWTIPAYARATPSVDAKHVYVWSTKGILAVDRATGKQKWLAKLDSKRADDDKTFAITGDRLLTRAAGKLRGKSSGSQDEIVQAIHAGKLQYRLQARIGNTPLGVGGGEQPWAWRPGRLSSSPLCRSSRPHRLRA